VTTSPVILRALERSPESVSIYALDGTVLFLNTATERIMGVTLESIRGQRMWELFPDTVGNAFHAAFEAAVATGEPQQFEHYYPPFNGWYRCTVERIDDQIVVYARDVTDELRRERRLSTLGRISEVLTRADHGLDGTAQAVVDIVSDVVGGDATLALLSSDGQTLEPVARRCQDPAMATLLARVKSWPVSLGHSGQALRERTSVLATTIAIGPDAGELSAVLARYNPGSIVVAPLLDADAAVGTLSVVRAAGSPVLNHHDRALLAELAPAIALYVVSARRREEAGTLRRRLSAMADALPALAAFVDTNERYQYVNLAYARWLGGDRMDYIGRRIDEIIAPEGYAVLEPYVKRALAGEEVRFQRRYNYPSGPRDVDARYIPIKREDGTLEGFAVLILDVSSDVRVSELERAATLRLQNLLTLTGRLAWLQRPEDVARELVDGGATALQTVSLALWERSGEGARIVRKAGGDEAVALRDEVVGCMHSMRPVWHPAAAVLPVGTDACLTFVFGNERRLTADECTYLEILASHGSEALRRAQAMTELHDASELQAAVIEASPMAVVLVDSSNVIRSWNRGAERIFGWTAAQAVGHAPKILGGDEQVFATNMRQIIAGQQLVRMDVRRQRANGDLVDVELYAAPLRRSDGEMLALAIMVDISERKAIERARLQMFEQAQTARAEAEAANRSKDEFLAMLGHELRNPLAPMVTALELMSMRGDGAMERERAVIGRQVQHLSRLVDDLLDVSRITRGKIELRRERLSVADLVAKAAEQTSPLFDERRHHLSIDVAPDLAVYGDSTRLAQIVSNLMTNAAKYTPRDGSIAVSARQAGDRIELAIRDNGIGIPASILPHVFDLFVQAPQSSERPAGGLGLGLTIVKSLVELHGGTVRASSEGPGRGSEFTIDLPAATAVATAAAASRGPRPVSGTARRILVVDDNEDAALLLADVLDAYGHEARTAFDGPSALRIASEFQPDVAVLDIGLPVMDGYELAERLRNQPSLRGVRLIAVTGYGQESDRRRSLEAGFQAHLAKPVQIEALVGLVEGR